MHGARGGSKSGGRVTLSYAEAANALGMGKASVQRAYQELVEHGFLALEKKGEWYSRRAHEWRLTTKPMDRAKGREIATNDWRQWLPGNSERCSKAGQSPTSIVQFENPKLRTSSK